MANLGETWRIGQVNSTVSVETSQELEVGSFCSLNASGVVIPFNNTQVYGVVTYKHGATSYDICVFNTSGLVVSMNPSAKVNIGSHIKLNTDGILDNTGKTFAGLVIAHDGNNAVVALDFGLHGELTAGGGVDLTDYLTTSEAETTYALITSVDAISAQLTTDEGVIEEHTADITDHETRLEALETGAFGAQKNTGGRR